MVVYRGNGAISGLDRSTLYHTELYLLGREEQKTYLKVQLYPTAM